MKKPVPFSHLSSQSAVICKRLCFHTGWIQRGKWRGESPCRRFAVRPQSSPLIQVGQANKRCVQQGTQTAALNGRTAIQLETKEKMCVFGKIKLLFLLFFFTFFHFLQPSKKNI